MKTTITNKVDITKNNTKQKKINIIDVLFIQLILSLITFLSIFFIKINNIQKFNEIKNFYANFEKTSQVYNRLVKTLNFIEHSTLQKIKKITHHDAKNNTISTKHLPKKHKFLKINSSDIPLDPPQDCILSPVFLPIKPTSPLENGILTCKYGYREHPITKNRHFHNGEDFAAPAGTPIKSILPGRVIAIGTSEIYGLYLEVEHPNNMKSIYCHCSKVTAKLYTNVRQGDKIAEVGSTGNYSTGNHLHITIKINDKNVDPALVFNKKQ
jgi:murein DD-endopeptidase MepM/ murein hydrolase activator NlpD